MILPPPETTTVNQSPEALVALMTLLFIALTVYGLGKIKFLNLKWVYRILFKRAGIS
ncbi:MAG: hypothetical protein JSS07_08610 [Proteobacteria bacterium]|nr:hypothetical protein [Pseudomonadota bacterium]